MRAAFFMMFFIFAVSGCATVKPLPPQAGTPPRGQEIYHKVEPGETLWRIAKMYNTTVDDLIRENNIPNVAHIEKNQLIRIGQSSAEKTKTPEKDDLKSADFDWPIRGNINSYFGEQKDFRFNSGIDIVSEAGSKVLASRDGRVVFADDLSGYGKTVVIDHEDRFMTIYAQNSALLVKLNDLVKKGAPVAQIGKNGQLAFLHFEIRKDAQAANPLFYLP